MPIVNGMWQPDLFGKQWEVFNAQSCKLLVSGSRYSAKTWAILHKIIRHMWDTKGARVAMFSKTIKSSKLAGTWDELHKITIPEWIQSGIGLEYTTKTNSGNPGPKVDGITRTPMFRITNRWGGESECMLFSLDFEPDIADKVKEQRFSCFYFSELDKFKSRDVLNATLPQLRMPHLKYAEHMWMADTNPDYELGVKSWIYKLWYLERTMSYEDYAVYCQNENQMQLDKDSFLRFQRSLKLIEMNAPQNIHLEKEKLDELKDQCAHDPAIYDAWVLGLWTGGSAKHKYHFRNLLKPEHILGDCNDLDESKWVYANPSSVCESLVTGWDLGDTNHAVVIMEKIIDPRTFRSIFVILDEVEHIKEETSVETVTYEVVEKITSHEAVAGHTFDLESAWSDSSSLTKYIAAADTFQHLQVMAYSEGRIELKGVEKAKFSVSARVQLLKKLLADNRIHVSAHCKGVLRMLREIKRSKDEVFDQQDPDKHIFDALTYPLLKECAEEFAGIIIESNVGRRKPAEVISL